MQVLEVDLKGNVKHTVLGHDLDAGQVPQYVVPPRVWFGAYPTKDYKVDAASGLIEALPVRDPEQNYSLVGCTVAPAFQFEDFEMAKRSELVTRYPKAISAITLLTDPE
jgi:predicted cupin superfamily sugar epimerase